MSNQAVTRIGGAASAIAGEFRGAISSSVDVLDGAVEQIMTLVRQLPRGADDLNDIELAVTEALANAIVHGNRQDPNKRVQISGRCEPSGDLLLAITDEGSGFDHNVVPDPTTGKNVFSNHGRGLHLIRHVMDSVEFRLGGRQLMMRKKGRAALNERIGPEHISQFIAERP